MCSVSSCAAALSLMANGTLLEGMYQSGPPMGLGLVAGLPNGTHFLTSLGQSWTQAIYAIHWR